MSRLLRINNIDVDIDDLTAIGIDFQSYDLKEPGKPKINISNTFTIPKTANNLAIFGNPDDPQSTSTTIYNQSVCDYWEDNEKLIDQTKIRVEEISERISLFIYDKIDFWDSIKKDFWPDFIDEFLVWMNAEKGLPIESDSNTDNASTFLPNYYDTTEGILLPFFMTNMAIFLAKGQYTRERIYVVKSGYALVFYNITITFTSNILESSPISFNITVSSALSDYYTALEIIDAINENDDINGYYTATLENGYTNRIIVTGNNFVNDTNLNIAISGTYIVDEPYSEFISVGLAPATVPFEYIYQNDSLSDAGINLKYKSHEESVFGGHFCVYLKTIFEFIEYKYNVNLLTSGGVLPGNIWDDTVAISMFMPIRDLQVWLENGNSYFYRETVATFAPNNDAKFCEDKTVFDFVKTFMNYFNIVKDEIYLTNERVIRFARFDDLENAEVLNFSDRLTGEAKFKPSIEGYAQNNYIKFKEIYEDGSEFLNSKNITSLNLNLDVNSDLFEIDAYVPGIVYTQNSQAISVAKDSESLKTFTFYVSTSETTLPVNIVYNDIVNSKVFGFRNVLKIAELYELNSEYTLLDSLMTYPKFYEIKKWLTISDIRNFEFFKLRWIQDLNGAFFVNKIKGFNSQSKQPTTIELIKVNNRTPVYPPDLDYWTDGVSDGWIDNELDYWY